MSKLPATKTRNIKELRILNTGYIYRVGAAYSDFGRAFNIKALTIVQSIVKKDNAYILTGQDGNELIRFENVSVGIIYE